jgi:dsDNA-binding SOS-regulon protein
MTIGFSISFGDCIGRSYFTSHHILILTKYIAGGKLLKDVAESFGNSRKAEAEYDSLMSMIQSLEPLLRTAQALRKEQDSEELKDYMIVTTNIKNLLASFDKKIAKFDGTMIVEDSNWAERLGTAYRKLEWTFLKPLVQDFKFDLNIQISILNAITSQLHL